jgi:pantothenate kinase
MRSTSGETGDHDSAAAVAAVVAGLSAELADRVDSCPSERTMLGITGAPGSGKSTLAAGLLDALGPERAVVVPMDGFHLSEAIIAGTSREHRKGAPDTFDVGGFLSLLARLRARDEDIVYAPSYRRGLEEPIAASIAVLAQIPLVIIEGNYLLLGEAPWAPVRRLLDEVWFVSASPVARRARLVRRHVEFGMEPDAATAWTTGPDEANALLVEATRGRADRVIDWP